MKNIESDVKAVIEEVLQSRDDLFLVDALLQGNGPNKRLIILIDGDSGVTIDDCAEVSRKFSKTFDGISQLEHYLLEVSSVGVDRPLSMHRQYKKNVGRNIRVIDIEDKKIEGTLSAVSEREIVLELSGSSDSRTIDIENIKKAKVLISFKDG